MLPGSIQKSLTTHLPNLVPLLTLGMGWLFNPEANQRMWMSQGFYQSGGQPPPCMFDSRFREGILAKLVLDWVQEEEHHLQIEAVSMAQWINSQLENTRSCPQGMHRSACGTYLPPYTNPYCQMSPFFISRNSITST